MRELEEFAERCRRELTEDVLPFWLARGWDRVHGGVYTCLGRDGALMDPTKSVWFQGRFAYVLSYAHNALAGARAGRAARELPLLAAAKSALDFLERHCVDARGKLYFEVAADGTPLRMRRSTSRSTGSSGISSGRSSRASSRRSASGASSSTRARAARSIPGTASRRAGS